MIKTVNRQAKFLKKNGKPLFWFLMSMLLLLGASYVYFVNTAAIHGVRMSQETEEMNYVGASISDLESRYFGG